MIYLTQLVYVIDGKEAVFQQFEDLAIPIISKYNGRLTLRVRPTENCIVESNIQAPYEIHLIEFDSEKDFDNFKSDADRKAFFHLKEASIRSSLLIKGQTV